MTEVIFEMKGTAAVLTLSNESKLNALTTQMLHQLESTLTRVEADPQVRAVILTGVGHKAFCCGADIAEWGPMQPGPFARDWVQGGHRLFDRLARFSKPTIGAINGHAFGGGLELAACCDIRLITPRALLAMPEATVGIVPGWSGTQRLTRLLPEPMVKEMVLFNRRISADRAVATGFAADVAEDVLGAALACVADLDKASLRANVIAKSMIHAAVGEDRGSAIEALGSAAAAATADRAEGVQAFLDKRAPVFGKE